MRTRVLRRQVVGIVCGHQRDAGATRELDQGFSNPLLGIKSVLLDFEEVVSLPHDFLKFNGRCRGFVAVVARQHRRGHTGHAS